MMVQGYIGAFLLAINPLLQSISDYMQLCGIFGGLILMALSIRYKIKETNKLDKEMDVINEEEKRMKKNVKRK